MINRLWRAGACPAVAVLVVAVTAAALLCAAPQAQAQRASTIIVLDGSNSMNARLPNDKVFKFVTVREALRTTLPTLSAGTEVGLTTFGARRLSDCTDVEIAVPPSPDANRVLGALEKFQPRGFSPVVLALRNTAKALPQGVEKASIVLVIDDLASCRGEDPCAVAAELKRQNPALAIHVVGLALRPADAQVLACVVRQTGGQLFNAIDGPAVAPAIEQAMALASLDRRQPTAPADASPAADAARREAAQRRPAAAPALDDRGPGLHLSARLAEGKPAIAVPVRWRIWRAADVTAEASAAPPLVEAVQPVLSRQLADGRYVVEAQAGLVTVRQPFDVVSQGPTPVAVNLNAALMSISAPQAAGADPAVDTVLTVTAAGGDAQGRRGTVLWIARGGGADLVVPAGSYRVRADAGLAHAERVVVANVGTASEIDLALAAGRLIVEADHGPGQAGADKPQLVLEADDPDNTAGRRELYRAVSSRLELTLPAGSYLLTLRRGAAETRERLLIKPGVTLSRAIALPTARIRLISRIGAGLPTGLSVRYRIERLDGTPRTLQRWGEAEPVVELSPGRYRIEARIGAQNAVVVREVEVRAGADGHVDLNTAAGGVHLKLAGNARQSEASGLGLGEVYWQIFDDRGEAVWRTGQAEPLLALGAGRYRVRAEIRERAFERMIDVRAGDNRTFEVGG